ncbi:hypothetical protein SNEBB_005808 [Seison nebaliae]|nr:hypothetical protein SNEBB_005808 [Seison nebaliae]
MKKNVPNVTLTSSNNKGNNKSISTQIVTKPFICGTVSKLLDTNPDLRIPTKTNTYSHEWTVYVRPYHANEDLEKYIKKVTFKLHDTYANCLRTVQTPPYEVHERGWGEFDVMVKIYFYDFKNVLNFSHHLPLFPLENMEHIRGAPLVHERYDEFLFVNPCDKMLRLLESSGPIEKCEQLNNLSHHNANWVTQQAHTTQELNEAEEMVYEEIMKLRKQLSYGTTLLPMFHQLMDRTEQMNEKK